MPTEDTQENAISKQMDAFPSFQSFPVVPPQKTTPFPTFSSFPVESLNQPKRILEDASPKPQRVAKKRKKRQKWVLDEEKDDFLSLDYYLDNRGDQNNLKYQELRNQVVPAFKRWGSSILGNRAFKISKASMRQKHLYLEQILYGNKTARVKYKDFARTRERIRLIPPSGIISTNDEYIKLPDEGSNEQKAGLEDDFKEDLAFQQKSLEADRLIQQDKTIAASWVAFVRLQDTLLETVPANKKQMMIQRITDKKVSILEKALEAIPDSEEIISEYLFCCEETLE